MLLLVAAATIVVAPPIQPTPARATVRILRPAVATEKEWKSASPTLRRHERVIEDEHGQTYLLRVIDYE